jgi:YfiH family protein
MMSESEVSTADFIVPDWPAPAAVRALSSTRSGGVSQGVYESLNLGVNTRDDPQAVAENRRRFTALLPSSPGWLAQVHGRRVVQRESINDTPEADAVWTGSAALACTIQTADCLPVLFCDRAGTHVAACHAGWRGLVGGVLQATLKAMPVPADQLMAWIGPGIGLRAYEVGAGFRAQVLSTLPQLDPCFGVFDGSVHADLPAMARTLLLGVGVMDVYGGHWCTYTDAERFFSYRRSADTGRMATSIWLEAS